MRASITRTVLAVTWMFGASSLAAQAPAASARTPLSTGTLAGVVRDTLGQPLAEVDVSIPDHAWSARTDETGTFVIAGIPPATYEVWARKIGFISVQFRWTSKADERLEVALRLRPLPHTLDPVVVWAGEERQWRSSSLVHGVVTDSMGYPMSGAQVQLIGTGRATVTAEDGTWTFRHVPPGDLVVRARLMGYSPSVMHFRLTADDQREVLLRLGNLAQQLDEVRVTDASGFGRDAAAWKELDMRTRWHTEGSSQVFGPEKLSRLGATPIDLVTRGVAVGRVRGPTSIRGSPPIRTGIGSQAPGDACILLDGITPVSRPLRSFSADDLEMIEFYPPTPPETDLTGTVADRMTGVPGCMGDRQSHPAYYVLWFKGAH